MEKQRKEFILFRIIKTIFYTGFINILPTLLVISIIVIAYNFLDKNLGNPINNLIKKQLRTNWQNFTIDYLKVNKELFKKEQIQTDQEILMRLKKSSLAHNEAKINLEHAEEAFNEKAAPFMKKKALSNDQEYIKYLYDKIDLIKKSSGYEKAKRKFDIEIISLNRDFEQEKKIIRAQRKVGENKPTRLREEIDRKYPDIIGLFITLILIFFIGLILTTVAGKTIRNFWTRTISSIPIIRKIYPYTKQLTDFLFDKKTSDFTSVVLVEYPKVGIYSMGFPTGYLNENNQKYVSILIPSSPTPFTGYTILVKESDLIPIDVSVEDAIKYTVTGGVIKSSSIKSINL